MLQKLSKFLSSLLQFYPPDVECTTVDNRMIYINKHHAVPVASIKEFIERYKKRILDVFIRDLMTIKEGKKILEDFNINNVDDFDKNFTKIENDNMLFIHDLIVRRYDNAMRNNSSSFEGTTGTITLDDDGNIVKNIHPMFQAYDVHNREAKYLKLLAGEDISPKLLNQDDFILVIENCGDNLDENNIPDNYHDQIETIINILKKHNISHNDIHKDNIVVDNDNKIRLIDFQWATKIGEKTPLDWPPQVKALWGDEAADDEYSLNKTFKEFKSTDNLQVFSNFHPAKEIRKSLMDLRHKDISIFYDYPTANDLNPTHKIQLNKINIFILAEPNEYFGMHDNAIGNQHLYTSILTWSDRVLDRCDNAVLLPTTGTWLDNDYIVKMENVNKKFEVSFLRGSLYKNTGHLIRHEIYDRRNEINIPKKFFDVLDDFRETGVRNKLHLKNIVWDESMFHLAIENSKHSSYMTEKVLDAFLTKTIPIYWGAPKIGEYFDKKGFFVFDTADEAIGKINNLTENDYYDRKDYIDKNYKIAKAYSNYWKMI